MGGVPVWFPNDSFYLKSPKEMKELFSDVPEAITNIAALVDECEGYVLERDVLLPAFDIPAEFVHEEDAKDGGKRGENAYLRHLTYLGAEKRYGNHGRDSGAHDFELETIERTGYPGYFLIVQDFTTAAREMGVSVGPGRGSPRVQPWRIASASPTSTRSSTTCCSRGS